MRRARCALCPRVTALVLLLGAGMGCDRIEALTPGGAGAGGRAGVDLVLHAVTVRQDRLVVLVANDGTREFASPIMVTVSDGAPQQIDLGSPLRPGEALEAVLNTEYVQRRARVAVAVTTSAEGDSNLDNNRIEAVVEPDQPLDVAIESAVLDALDGHLVVTIASQAPIPLVGMVTVIVRERPPSNQLLVASEQPIDIAASGTQRVELREVVRPDLTRLTVAIATDAIADADSANDIFPR